MGRIRAFNLDDVPPEIVSRSRQLVDQMATSDIRDVSAGLLSFYNWVTIIKQFIATITLSKYE